MTCQDVAEHLGVSWDVIRDIEKRNLKRHFSKPPLKDVTPIAIDEMLYDLWEQDDYEEGFQALTDWIADAEWSNIPEIPKSLRGVANTLRNHWQQILDYYYCNLTSGPLEGLNNKIKTLKRQAYGFRNQEYFKRKILAIHRTRYALGG